MFTLTLKWEEGDHRIPFVPGQSLRHLLDTTVYRVRSGCNGTGACGLCRVRILAGNAGEPKANERIHLDDSQLALGVRLACQVMPEHDLRIEILDPAPRSNWRSLPHGEIVPEADCPVFPSGELYARQVKAPLGAAVDLGTTHISLSIWNLETCHWLAGRIGLNPQVRSGFDVVTRLVDACESQDKARSLSREARGAIGDALLDMATREAIDLNQVKRLFIVGNTAMLALLAGRNYGLLTQPSFWTRPIDCLPKDTSGWSASWGIHPEAGIEIPPPLAGFMGSDLLAGILSTGLTKSDMGGLFIDFGTNSELALWDGRFLWATSAAGGPAFEGSGMSCGMPAEPGAVYRVGFRNGQPDLAIIADSEMRGLCGSGMLDLISNLVRRGDLTREGRFAPEMPGDRFVLAEGGRSIELTKADVDIFQQAKAAIGTAILTLLSKSGMGLKDIKRLCVGGAFGHFLNLENALDIGLLPRIKPERIELCGNTALAGCESALLSPAAAEDLESLREKARIVNLSLCDDFDDIFFDNLYLDSMKG